MYRSPVLFVCLFSFLSFALPGQTMLLDTPNASSKAAVEQTVGLTTVRIDYHRPAVRDREVWGELVPYHTPWRAGANENTVISFSSEVQIEGQPLAAGTYGLHLIPHEDNAVLIFSHNATSWGSYSYQESEDALRVTIPVQKIDLSLEQLSYYFENVTTESADCVLHWEKRRFPFTITTDVHQIVLDGIRRDLRNKAGWTWQGWHEAASYCLQNEVNLQEGLSWAGRSVFMQPNSNNMITKAQLVSTHEGLAGDAATKRELDVLDNDLSRMSVTWKEYMGAAQYARSKSETERAMTWIQHSIDMHPTMTNMMARHDMLLEAGETKKAAKIKKEALARGTNAELNIYAYQLMWSGKTADAVAIFEVNAERNPGDPNVWDSLGEGYLNNGQTDKAIEALRKSLSLNPPSNVKANSMRLLRQLGVNPSEVTDP